MQNNKKLLQTNEFAEDFGKSDTKNKPSKKLNSSKSKAKTKHLIFAGKWKDGLPCLSPDYLLDFKAFPKFQFLNIFDLKLSVQFFSLGFYFGEMNSDQKFHGRGSCFYKNGFFYRGRFKEGIWHGKGEVFCGLHRIYKGEFQRGVIHGLGNLYQENGCILIGNFDNGKISGEGKILMPSGAIFQGSFKESRRHGRGKVSFPDKSTLEGEFVKGSINGIAYLSKLDSRGEYLFFKRRYKHGRLQSEVQVSKKPRSKKACCLKFSS